MRVYVLHAEFMHQHLISLVQTDFGDWKDAGCEKVQNKQGTGANLKGLAKHMNSQTHKEAMKM